MGADEAFTLGLVSEVFPDESFMNMTDELVDVLLRKAPSALRGMKQNYLAAERLPFGEFVELEARRHLELMAGPDATEAFARMLRSGRRSSANSSSISTVQSQSASTTFPRTQHL